MSTGERTTPTGGVLAAPPDRPSPIGSRRARPAAPDRIPLLAAIRTGGAPIPGEPVDTSFAEPTQTPAAHAAGAAPSSGEGRDDADPDRGAHRSARGSASARESGSAGEAGSSDGSGVPGGSSGIVVEPRAARGGTGGVAVIGICLLYTSDAADE